MTEGDYRDRIGRQDFQVRLSEMSTDEIKLGLKTKVGEHLSFSLLRIF